MKLLEDRILRDGKVLAGNVLRVDNFVNHQIDTMFMRELGAEIYRRYAGEGITKILTIEASGIGIACLIAPYFEVPVVFARKKKTTNLSPDVYTAPVESYTHHTRYDIMVSREYLQPEDRVLIIDDFLAKGSALHGLISLVRDAGATLVGVGIIIEKAYQDGGKIIRDMGVRVESLARIASMGEDGSITFAPDPA